MNTKTLMIALAAFAVGGVAHAITSDEIAAALDVDPSVGTFSCSGFSDWLVDTGTSHDGVSSLRSGQISPVSDWRNSMLLMTLDVKTPSRLKFWLKTFCYNNTNDTRLDISDGQAVNTYTGERDWTLYSVVLIPGNHLLRWNFQKRSYNTSRSDYYVRIDGLTIEPILDKSTQVEVTDVKCKQRYPWNGMVDIDYTVKCEKKDAEVWVYPVGYDKDSNTTMAPRALSGDGVDAPVSNGTFRMTWKVTDDYPNFHSTAFTVKMAALVGAAPYMVVDLAGGVDALSYPVSYLSRVPAGGWGDEYKTTKMVFRMIPSGSFMMGSPSDEWTRGSYEDLHGVVLTRPFYIGVFECTQKQYELVMGSNPVTSSSYKGDLRPVANVSYNTLRGSVNGAGWPTHNQVDANSFMGRLRSKVNMFFDLPTEAEWEYACRAGTSTSLNSGKNYDWDVNCNEVARWARNAYNSGTDYKYDGKGGYTYSTKVGCYLENAWGLFDMHGNVNEWCRDFWNYGLGYAGTVDPKGASRGYNYGDERVYRGGHYDAHDNLRSADRDGYARCGNAYQYVGFRVMCSPVAE